jgi:hypothetical protein
MELVAMKPRPADATPARAELLCAATGLATYEGRSRLRVLDGWPGIVTVHAEPERAHEVAGALRAAGFVAWVMQAMATEPRLVVRRFAIEEALLRVDVDDGTALAVPLEDVRLLLHTRRREEREGFVHAIAAGVPTLVFGASALRYAELPDAPVAPTRVANFARVVAQLRERIPAARFDDRLLSRVSQVRLLGPMLPPERHLDVAISLLTHHLARRDDPYR